jgi:hypothetical protein
MFEIHNKVSKLAILSSDGVSSNPQAFFLLTIFMTLGMFISVKKMFISLSPSLTQSLPLSFLLALTFFLYFLRVRTRARSLTHKQTV